MKNNPYLPPTLPTFRERMNAAKEKRELKQIEVNKILNKKRFN